MYSVPNADRTTCTCDEAFYKSFDLADCKGTTVKSFNTYSCNGSLQFYSSHSKEASGLFLESPGNLSGLKPFLVDLYRKTEQCISLKLLV